MQNASVLFLLQQSTSELFIFSVRSLFVCIFFIHMQPGRVLGFSVYLIWRVTVVAVCGSDVCGRCTRSHRSVVFVPGWKLISVTKTGGHTHTFTHTYIFACVCPAHVFILLLNGQHFECESKRVNYSMLMKANISIFSSLWQTESCHITLQQVSFKL